MYNKIDLVYEIFPDKGIEYSLLLHPGADLSKVKMQYSSNHTNVADENIEYYLDHSGNVQIKTSLGNITEKDLGSYYKEEKSPIVSHYNFDNDILSFQLDNYDNTKEIVIDPWIVSETANGAESSSAVWEVETDNVGNVYTISNEKPMQLKKYNSAGSWQWTYNTPWDTASVWLGTLATDQNGNSYITSGTAPEIEKINASGTMLWHAIGFNSSEYWSIIFCGDTNKILVGGTYVPNISSFDYYSAIFEISTNNGNVLNYQTYDSVNVQMIGVPLVTPIEVRSMATTNNSKLVFLTHKYVASINQDFSICPNMIYQNYFNIPYAYKCENFLPETQNGGGLKAIIAGDHFFYSHAGDRIYKYSLSDGSLVDSVILAGGLCNTALGQRVIYNSGLDVDSCNNLYVGSGDRIIKFDENLNFLQEVLLPFTVYDVKVNTNGEVIAVGAEFSDTCSTNRHGQIQSVVLNACAPHVFTHSSNAGICSPANLVCATDSAFNLISIDTGGVWSGTGIVDTIAGTFNPSVANMGNNTIYYQLPDGTIDSTVIDVEDCTPINVCYDSTYLVATNGFLLISWQEQQLDTFSILTEQDCIDCPSATPQYNYGSYLGCDLSFCYDTIWVEFATGDTILPPINWPLRITDGNTSLVYNSLSEIPICNPVSIQNQEKEVSQIKIHPNPANQILYVDYNKAFTIEIYNITGKRVMISNKKEINISKLKAGLFQVAVKNKKGKILKTEKLIIQ